MQEAVFVFGFTTATPGEQANVSGFSAPPGISDEESGPVLWRVTVWRITVLAPAQQSAVPAKSI
jgi:hypothetical protein